VPFEISSLKYLETIILNNNSITACSFTSKSIKKIIANFNKITSINGSFFSQYPNLQVLSLISNRIKKTQTILEVLKI
jgi:Leucine-rich repeat (LRR) protein